MGPCRHLKDIQRLGANSGRAREELKNLEGFFFSYEPRWKGKRIKIFKLDLQLLFMGEWCLIIVSVGC